MVGISSNVTQSVEMPESESIQCPKCNSQMYIVEPCNGEGHFVVYKCCEADCKGQWLRFKQKEMYVDFMYANMGGKSHESKYPFY